MKPCDFLEKNVGRKVRVYLKDESRCEGILFYVERRREEIRNILIKNSEKWYLIRGGGIYFIQILK